MDFLNYNKVMILKVQELVRFNCDSLLTVVEEISAKKQMVKETERCSCTKFQTNICHIVISYVVVSVKQIHS